MTNEQVKTLHPFAYDLFIVQPWNLAPPAPPATQPKPKREDYPTNWDWARALLKWTEAQNV